MYIHIYKARLGHVSIPLPWIQVIIWSNWNIMLLAENSKSNFEAVGLRSYVSGKSWTKESDMKSEWHHDIVLYLIVELIKYCRDYLLLQQPWLCHGCRSVNLLNSFCHVLRLDWTTLDTVNSHRHTQQLKEEVGAQLPQQPIGVWSSASFHKNLQSVRKKWHLVT